MSREMSGNCSGSSGSCTGNSATATSATSATTATNATNVNLTAGSSTTNYIPFSSTATGNQPLKTDTGLSYNATTHNLTTTTFTGTLSGNATTATSATSATSATTATNANNVNLTAGSGTTNYITFASSATGNQQIETDTNLLYNASSHTLSVPNMSVNGTSIIYNGVPIGTIVMYCSTTPPTGWLNCQGQSLSTTGTYANLYAVIGTSFGSGTGTFNIPDLQSRFPISTGSGSGLSVRSWPTNQATSQGGAESTTLQTTNIPAHSHGAGSLSATSTVNTIVTRGGGAPYLQGSSSAYPTNQGTISSSISGSTANSTASTTAPSIIPPFTILNFIIKYA